jgi:hypothetical protein
MRSKIWVGIISLFYFNTICAQQNLFNVPSSDITTKNRIFFQEQLNIGKVIQSNTNICYGLGNGFEVGANIIGLQSDKQYRKISVNDSVGNNPVAPIVVFTAQKVFEVAKFFKIGIGTQIGTNMIKKTGLPRTLTDFTYLNTQTAFFHERIKVNAGAFFGDKAYIGEKSQFGYMLGYEATVGKRIHLVGDYFAGKNPIGVVVVGFLYYATAQMPLSFGWQIPNDPSKASQAFVFEFTYIMK